MKLYYFKSQDTVGELYRVLFSHHYS